MAILTSGLIISNYFIQYNYYLNRNIKQNGNKIYVTCSIDSFYEKIDDRYKVICKTNKERFLLQINEVLVDKESDLKIGNKVSINAIYQVPKQNTTPNLFNYQLYLNSKKINAILYADEFSIVESKLTIIQVIKYKLFQYINRIPYKKEYAFAILFSSRSYFEESYNANIQTLNIAYLFAVSGLHIGIIVKCLYELLRRIMLNESIIQFLIAVILLFYCYLTNFSPSILRASLFVIFLFIKRRFDLHIDHLQVLSIIYLILLLINPFSLSNIGFVLSFLMTTVFLISGKLINCYSNNKMIKLLLVNLIAQSFSLPIIASMNYSYNFLSLVTNIPLALLYIFFIMPVSILIIFLPSTGYYLQTIFNGYEHVISLLSRIEIFTVNVGVFSVERYCIYYVLLFLICRRLENRKSIKKWSVLIVLVTFMWNTISFHDEVIFFDVGQGDSALLRSSFNKCTTIVDTSGTIQFEGNDRHPSAYSVIPYLKSQSISTINYLFISHGDADHAGDYQLFFDSFTIDHIVLSGSEQSTLKDEIIATAKDYNTNIILIDQETSIQCDDFIYTVFAPIRTYNNKNDQSLIIKATLNHEEILFTGDISKQVEKDLVTENTPFKNVAILKIAHHGSNTSTSSAFLDYVGADIAVISVGKNGYGHPSKEVLKRLEETKTVYYRTDKAGSVKITYYFGRYRIIKPYPPYNIR